MILQYRCNIPGVSNDTYKIQSPYHEALVNQSVPMVTNDGETTYSSCRLYDVDNSSVTSHLGNQSETGCDEWVYDRSIFKNTVVTQVKLIYPKT